jgi:hypothetical protein
MGHYLLHPALGILWLINIGLLVLKIWAVVDCVTRPAAAFEAHNKLTKVAWLVILVLALLTNGVLGLFALVGTIAAIVYLVDVRPAVSGSS